MPTHGDVCPACRYASGTYWLAYHCPECGALHEALYRREHVDPARGQQMTREEIDAEIAVAVRAGTYDVPGVAA